MAIGCAANWRRNRTFHCAISGPVLLVSACVFLLSGVTAYRVNVFWVWIFVLTGVGVAFLLECGMRGGLRRGREDESGIRHRRHQS